MWNDADKAQRLMTERNTLADQISRVRLLETQVQDTYDMIELAEAEGDADLLA